MVLSDRALAMLGLCMPAPFMAAVCAFGEHAARGVHP